MTRIQIKNRLHLLVKVKNIKKVNLIFWIKIIFKNYNIFISKNLLVTNQGILPNFNSRNAQNSKFEELTSKLFFI